VALFLDFIKKALTKLFLTVTVDFLIIIFENEKHEKHEKHEKRTKQTN
jgi:hypothetical protein